MGSFLSSHKPSSATTNSTRRRSSRATRFIESNPDGFHLGALFPNPSLQILEQHSEFFENISNGIVRMALENAEEIAADRAVGDNDGQFAACLDRFGRRAVVAAIAYSLEVPPLYETFNEAVRQMAMGASSQADYDRMWDNLAPYSGLYCLLHSMEAKVPALPDSVALYRGCSAQFRARKGETVSLTTFTSTSTDRETAETQFAGPEGTLLIFTGPLITGLDMRPMSDYPDEAEVLLFPFQTFTVQSIAKQGKQTLIRLYSRKMEALEAFREMNRFFPVDTTSYTLYNISLRHADDTLFIRPCELDRAGYHAPSPTALQHINNLPAYDIVEKSRTSGDDQVDEPRKVIIANYAAVRAKYNRGESVYRKHILTLDDGDENYVCAMSELNVAEGKSFLDAIELQNPAHTATSYVLSVSPAPSDVQLIFDLMSKQYHHLLTVKSVLYISEADRTNYQIEIATSLAFLALSFLLCLSPVDPITSTFIDPLKLVASTAQYLLHYAKLRFPEQFQNLKNTITLHYCPLCFVCGRKRQMECTC